MSETDSRNIEDIYPLSPLQFGMLFHTLYDGESGLYFEQTGWHIRGDLKPAAFEKAWQGVINRHAALRASFVWEDIDDPLQIIHRDVTLTLEQHDWRSVPADQLDHNLQRFFAEERERGFPLDTPPLMRITLIQTGPDAFIFVWSHHHLLLDGWSQGLIFQEAMTLYSGYIDEYDGTEMAPATPYSRYIGWLQAQDEAETERFWRSYLGDFAEPTILSTQKKRADLSLEEQDDGMESDPASGAADATAEDAEEYVVQAQYLPEKISAQIETFTNTHRITLNSIMQAAWALTLQLYSGQDDIMFGATVSGRPPSLADSETIVGLFINTLPVRVSFDGNRSLHEWLTTFNAQLVDLRQYEHSALVDVQGWSSVPRDQPLFETIFVFENYPIDTEAIESTPIGGLQFEEIHAYDRTNYPLALSISPSQSGIGVEIAFETETHSKTDIDRLIGHYIGLLDQMTAGQDMPLRLVDPMTEAERELLLNRWQGETRSIPNRPFYRRFEEQVAKTPDHLAVVAPADMDQPRVEMSYGSLNSQANRLARRLQQLGVKSETVVALSLDRTPDIFIATLAVMKAGGTYLPIDPTLSTDRRNRMLRETGAALLISSTSTPTDLNENSEEPLSTTVYPLSDLMQDLAQFDDGNLEIEAAADQLAYIIYTSGSTGQPKGVMVSQRSLKNAFCGWESAYELSNRDIHLQMANFTFDVFAGDMVRGLGSGATIVLTPREWLLDPQKMADLIQKESITIAEFVPGVLRPLVAQLQADGTTLSSMRMLVCGSDVWHRSEYAQTEAVLSEDATVVNSFGLTEATIDSSWYGGEEIALVADDQSVPIGRPFDNVSLYILDQQLRPTPIGVAGELFVGGAGIARGYVGQPSLTASRFIPHPFSNAPGARLYATGDQARFLPNGNIEFIGRVDNQIKIRGYRIEPAEVEAILTKHPAIAAAAVDAADAPSGDKRLVGYVIIHEEAADSISPFALKQAIRAELPDYMVPSVITMLDEMPLTPNGKIDRKRLPEPDWSARDRDDTYLPPATPTEEILANLWSQVLGIEKIGRYDDFFLLGGHSLSVTQVISRSRTAFQLDIQLRDLFERATLTDFAARVDYLLLDDSRLKAPPLLPADRSLPLSVSFGQQRLWFLDQLEPGSLFYNMPLVMRLQGALNIEALQQTIDTIVERHEVLRTTFDLVDGKPVQTVQPAEPVDLPVEDISHLPDSERETAALALATDSVQRPFDLANGPLLRVKLIRVSAEDHIAVVTKHHIVSDGWSQAIFMQEVAFLYQAYTAGHGNPLPDLPIQYVDYANWQRAWLQGEVLEEQLSYWTEQLSGAPPLLDLPTDRPRPAVQSANGTTYSFPFPDELSTGVRALTREMGTTLFVTLLSAFQTLLYRYSGQEDICVGSPISNRSREELEGLIGFFVNTLVFRSDLSENPTFDEVLEQVRDTALDAYSHQDLPFEMLVQSLEPDRNLSHTPLFQVMFVLDNVPNGVDSPAIEMGDLMLSQVDIDGGSATFDLTLSIIDNESGLYGMAEYNTDLFDAETIERMMGHYQVLLNAIVEDPETPINELPLLTEPEEDLILDRWNATAVPYEDNVTIHSLIEEKAETQPDAIAVTYNGSSLTYAELNQKGNQLAHYLQKMGVGPEVLVGLSTMRSLDMVVGLLGVLKAGGAYIPLDPSYPVERLTYMVNDAQLTILLSQERLAGLIPNDDDRFRVVNLDTDWEKIAAEPESNPTSETTAENLAYVIYTSGSTGNPKGTMLRHRGLCNLTDVQRRTFNITPASKILQFSPLSFDASVWETFMALRNGATLVLADQETLASGPELIKLLQREGVTNATLPPSLLQVLPAEALPKLETVIAAGEACPVELVQTWGPGRTFVNAYGPTESTVCASLYICDPADPNGPPIGRPLDNIQLYVLDPHEEPVPIGVPGELHIGGAGLARGYLNRPDLTEKKFIPNRFSPDETARLYKSGDLVRFRPDGNIEFVGRIDHQVKLRGFRIELGEVEAVLGEFERLQACAIIVREDTPGDQRMVAYVVPAADQPEAAPTDAELRAYLQQSLPDYMVPSIFVTLDALPLTPNNKIDRRALPEPDHSRPELAQAYVAPRNETEAKLAEICQTLLGVEQVGVYDSFFDLGGHSLLATQLISRLRDEFDIELPLRTLFEQPTVNGLAEAVLSAPKRDAATAAPAITAVSRDRRRAKKAPIRRGK